MSHLERTMSDLDKNKSDMERRFAGLLTVMIVIVFYFCVLRQTMSLAPASRLSLRASTKK